MKNYVLSIDQSTQKTKAFLFDRKGSLISQAALPHRQIVNEAGWVSHDPEEIYRNTLEVIRQTVAAAGVSSREIACIGISNQRETSLIWDRKSGTPLEHAVVWQCSRAAQVCQRPQIREAAEKIRKKTGLVLSPYYPAAKYCWLLEHLAGRNRLPGAGQYCLGTMDSYLLFRLTGGNVFATDLSNAARTQLFDISSCNWDEEICGLFGIDPMTLPEVKDSDAVFGCTDCEGIFEEPVPVHGILGDSNAALFAHHCTNPGDVKATYGTGSSVMMNIGEQFLCSSHGLSSSLAWSIKGRRFYVLEGNINYSGAVIAWLKDRMMLIQNEAETVSLAQSAQKDDQLYLIPAFTGLSAPYWNSDVKAAFTGMDRTTGKAEIVRAALESIAYQITDVVRSMEADVRHPITSLKADGGATGNSYLMQFQSDILGCKVSISDYTEMSGMGAALMAGMAAGCWTEEVYQILKRRTVLPEMTEQVRKTKYDGYMAALKTVLGKTE